MYRATTNGITVIVQSYYLEDQSMPDASHYVWAYTVKIENNSNETVQLRRRHWKVTDGNGCLHEVFGAGVVGEEPLLKPQESFEYTSGTPLSTPTGIMAGTYHMERKNGEFFEIDIPTFSLDSPQAYVHVN